MRKLFTLIAVTLFAFAANASLVTWDADYLDTVWVYAEDGVPDDPENNTNGGVTVTADVPSGNVGMAYKSIWFEVGMGTITFTSSIGNITKIEIGGSETYSKYNPGTESYDDVDNFEGAPSGTEWSWVDEFMSGELKGKMGYRWEGTPAASVNLSSADFVINEIHAIQFTIDDPFQDLEINFKTSPYTVLSGTGTLVSGEYHDNTHGYLSPVISTSLKAGNYKITVGNCQFSNQPGSLKNADGSATLNLIDSTGLTITSFTTPKNCYDSEKAATTTTSVWYVANEAQTVRIVCPQYTPYLKVEQVNEVPAPPAMYTVTFVNNTEGVNGTVPSPIEVPAGNNITIPANRTLYKEGYTLTCWSGTNNYVPGSLFEPTGNTTLTAVFTANTKELLSATNEVVVKWYFGEANGAPSMNYEGSNGFLVAQATVSGETQDVKLQINATNGKFNNGGDGKNWCQANAGTALIFPSKADATVEVKAYYQPLSNLRVDTQAATLEVGSEGNYVSTFATNPNFADESRFSVIADNYLSYLQVTFPAPDPTAIDNTNAEAKAVKHIVNGQLLIEKNGKFYNALGAEVK